MAALLALAGAAGATDRATLEAQIKAARYEAASARSDSPEQVKALEKVLELQTRLYGEGSPELVPTIRHLAATVPLDDPQRSHRQIPYLLRILKIQVAGGPAMEKEADATRADLVLYHDVTGQFAASIPFLRERAEYLARTRSGELPAVALDLSRHLLKAGDGAGARAALSVLPEDCLVAWADACAEASDHLFDMAMEADDVETLDRLGAGLVRRLRAGDCRPRMLRNVSLYFGYKADDDAGHRLYTGLLSNPSCTPDQRDEAIDWLEQAYGDYAVTEPLRRKRLEQASTEGARAEASEALGFNLWSQGRAAEASPFLQAAVDHLLGSPGADPSRLSYATLWLAESYKAAGEVERALAAVEATYRHAAVAKAVAANPLDDVLATPRARLLIALGRQPQARELLQRRLVSLGEQDWVYSLPDAVKGASEALAAAGDPAAARSAVIALARRFGRNPNVPRVERQTLRLRAAEAASREPATRPQALDEIRAILADVRALEAGLAGAAGDTGASVSEALSGDLVRPDRGRAAALGLLLDVGYAERERTPGLEAEAFVAAQDLEVSAAARAMAQTAGRIAAGPGELGEAARRQQALSRDLQAANAALTAALTDSDNAEIEEREAEVSRLARDLASAGAHLRKTFPQYAELVSPASLSLAETRRRLRPREGLILIADLWDDVHVFAVSKTRIAWTRLDGGSESVAARVAKLRCQVDETTCGEVATTGRRGGAARKAAGTPDAPIPAFDLATAHGLYRDLIAPVESALEGVEELFVTASGPLSGLPIGLLVTSPPPEGVDAGSSATLAATPWLADRYALVTLPSVSSLRAFDVLRQASPNPQAFRGFGDPVLKGDGFALAQSEVHKGDAGRQRLANPEMLRLGLAPLPHTRGELLAIARSLGAPESSLRLGPEATETAVKSDPALASARVVVFATHGLIPTVVNQLDEPGLVLTPPATASAMDDGLLSASEAAGLTLSADWLILSACNTAAANGKPEAESLSGLARAFLYAGAKALLASHWSVLDDATEALMVETLATQRTDPTLTKAEAVRRAMTAVRTGRRADGGAVAGWQPVWAHPAAWSPFVLIAAGE